MKKLLLLSIIGIIVILSGCSADGDWIDGEDTSIYGSLKYDFSSMTYTNTPSRDIFYQVDNTYSDFILVIERELDTRLEQSEKEAYINLFLLFDQLIDSSSLVQSDLTNLSSSEFNAYLASFSITPSLADIIAFNNYKLLVEELELTIGDNDVYIYKIDYIEDALETNINSEELDSLDLLQSSYEDLYNTTQQPFDFKNSTIDDLLVAYDEYLNYIPSESQLVRLEIAYTLLLELLDN